MIIYFKYGMPTQCGMCVLTGINTENRQDPFTLDDIKKVKKECPSMAIFLSDSIKPSSPYRTLEFMKFLVEGGEEVIVGEPSFNTTYSNHVIQWAVWYPYGSWRNKDAIGRMKGLYPFPNSKRNYSEYKSFKSDKEIPPGYHKMDKEKQAPPLPPKTKVEEDSSGKLREEKENGALLPPEEAVVVPGLRGVPEATPPPLRGDGCVIGVYAWNGTYVDNWSKRF